jgi:hypothetical protein
MSCSKGIDFQKMLTSDLSKEESGYFPNFPSMQKYCLFTNVCPGAPEDS